MRIECSKYKLEAEEWVHNDKGEKKKKKCCFPWQCSCSSNGRPVADCWQEGKQGSLCVFSCVFKQIRERHEWSLVKGTETE